jgi:hypothetical protein
MILTALIISFLLNCVLGFATWNLSRKAEITENFLDQSYIAAHHAYQDMRDLDERGAFAADDEVGLVFRSLKEIVADYAKFIGVEEAMDESNEQ